MLRVTTLPAARRLRLGRVVPIAINKVDFGGKTLIDLTADTVTAADLRQGVTAHDRTGEAITGTYTPSSSAVQMTSGIINGYSGGVLAIRNLGFDPDIVVVQFSVTRKGRESNFFASAIATVSNGYNTVCYNGFATAIHNKIMTAELVGASAAFDGRSVSWPLIDINDKDVSIGPIKWWAFGGL